MLAAMLIAGLATAALVPIVMMGGSDDDDVDIDLPEDDTIDLLDGLDHETGATYDIPASASETVLNSFDPEVDRLTLNADDWATEFVVEPMEDGGITLRFDVADGTVSVVFPDLNELPVDAIDLAVQEEGDDEPSFLPLVEVFAAEDPADPLDPTDPDAPEDSNSDQPIDEILPPTDPDAPDIPPDTPIEEEVLDPVEDPEPVASLSFDGAVAGHLYPGPDGAPPEPVVVEGFEVSDYLIIELVPTAWPGPQIVSGEPSASGEDGIVSVDGIPVAMLIGVPDVPLSRITIVSGGPG